MTKSEIGFIIFLISSVLLYHRPKHNKYDHWFAIPEFGFFIGLYLLIS
jgi:hypothetical protein